MWVCRLPVHIGPLGSCEFAGDSRKIGAFCRADVGIDPYNQTGKCDTNSPKAFAFRSCLLRPLRRFAPAPLARGALGGAFLIS